MNPNILVESKHGKVLAAADFHWDFWDDVNRDPLQEAMKAIGEIDALFVCGDLANKPKKRLAKALSWLAEYIDPSRIMFFPGNHDFYQYFLDREERLKEITESSGANYVQDKAVIVGNTRFLCSTLWTDLELAPDLGHIELHKRRSNDYRVIRLEAGGYRRVHPSDIRSRHHEHLAFLKGALAEEFAGETVVLTHHAPVPVEVLFSRDRYERNQDKIDMSWNYASDLRDVIETYQPAKWYYGHTHKPHTEMVGNCEVRNISLGYPEHSSKNNVTTGMSDEEVFERIVAGVINLNPSLASSPSLR